jgi:hypothetical protein
LARSNAAAEPYVFLIIASTSWRSRVELNI